MTQLPPHVVFQIAFALANGEQASVRLPNGKIRTYHPDGTVTTAKATIRGHHPALIVLDEAPIGAPT